MNPIFLFLKNKVFWALSLILAITAYCYFPALNGHYLDWDDDVHVTNNITIRSLDGEHLKEIFNSTVNKIYIPLTTLSFALEYHFVGYSSFLSHLINIILHLANTLMIFYLSRYFGLGVLGSLTACFLFGVHPMHVESVAWITERKDVLYGFFYLLSMLVYGKYLDSTINIKGVEKGKAKFEFKFLFLATFLGFLSMLAKPMALSLPLIWLVMDWFKGRKINASVLFEKSVLICLIVIIGWKTYSTHARIPGNDLISSVLIWAWSFSFYLRQFLFPAYSIPLYPSPYPISLSNIEYLYAIAVLFFVIVSLYIFRRRRWYVLAIVYYFVSIFFLLRFDTAKDANIVADRFMYLPSMGIVFWIGWLMEVFFNSTKRNQSSKRALSLVLIVLSIVIILKTWHQSKVWSSTISLWTHQLKYDPANPAALNNISGYLLRREDYNDAVNEYKKIQEFKKQGLSLDLNEKQRGQVQMIEQIISFNRQALDIAPNFADVLQNFGILYYSLGDEVKAEAYLKQSIKSDPKDKDPYFNLGKVYLESGKYDKAIATFNELLQLVPREEDAYINIIKEYNRFLRLNKGKGILDQAINDAFDRYVALILSSGGSEKSFFNLASLYLELEQYQEAIQAYKKVLDMNPNHPGALNNLGNIYREAGQIEEAKAMYKKALQSDGRLSDAYLNLGLIYNKQGNLRLARENYQRSIDVNHSNAKAYFSLGFLDEKVGNKEEAIKNYLKSIDTDPKYAEAYYNLGNVYASLNRNNEAIDQYLKAVKINPDHVSSWVNLSILSYHLGDFKNAVKYCDEAVLAGYDAPEGYLKTLEKYRETK